MWCASAFMPPSREPVQPKPTHTSIELRGFFNHTVAAQQHLHFAHWVRMIPAAMPAYPDDHSERGFSFTAAGN
eukprot:COSAG06_NODE_57817_length_279_cov_0.577778_1_plen_72_part_10